MMKKLGLLILIAATLGCANMKTPQVESANFGYQREGVYGYRGRVMHFLIITDGSVNEIGNSNSILGPSWAGFIQPINKGAHVIQFACGVYKMEIDKHEFSLANGNAFVISTKNSDPLIRQINVSVEDQVQALIKTDPRFNIQ